jgi:hypothetical protein
MTQVKATNTVTTSVNMGNEDVPVTIDYIKVGAYEQSKDKNNFNCSEYHFASLNQQVIKASEDRKQWNTFYAYSPNCPIPKLQIV